MANIDIRERQYISQYSTDGLGLLIMRSGLPADADGDVTCTVVNEGTGATLLQRPATRQNVGEYLVTTNPEETSFPGLYTVVWTYQMLAQPQEYRTYIEIGQADPDYDRLQAPMKDLVDLCLVRFADTFDSPGGGPNLKTYFQTHFDRGRLAQLLRIAVGTLNTVAQPFQTYTVEGPQFFPVEKWGPLLEKSLYIEVLKHLVRSYVEQPMLMGGNVTRMDRRDYMDRWRMVLQDEEATFNRQLEHFKIASMSLGKAAVLVSGGVYGRYGPTRVAGSVAARPRMWTRWY